MTTLMRWSSWVFVLAASSLVFWARTEGHKVNESPKHIWILFLLTVATLPIAAIQVYKDYNAKSRRNWVLMLVILAVLLVAALLMKPVRSWGAV
jgi:hypothetical protein